MATQPNSLKPFLTVFVIDVKPGQYGYNAFYSKLCFRLRHAGIPYGYGVGKRRQAPKSKMPYVRFEETGDFMGDSGLITKKLIEMGKLEDVNAGLGSDVAAADFCLRSMIEDRMYYFLIHERWFVNGNEMLHGELFSDIPWGFRHLTGVIFRTFVRAMLYFQGTGRHSPEEIKRLQTEAIDALAGYAEAAQSKSERNSTEPFWILGGKEPTEADFTLFGYLSGLLAIVKTNPFTTDLIKARKPLVDYVERIHNKYFADYVSPF